MRIEDWPVCRTSEFLAAYDLDFSGAGTATLKAGFEENLQSSSVAAVWDSAGRLSDARIMVVNTPERSWIAAGSVMVEGRPGLNIGLLMPSLREVPGLPAGIVPLPRHDAPFERAIWALATRLARIEARRVVVLDAGEIFHIDAGSDGFRLDAGTSVDDLRRAVAGELQSGRFPRYTLVADALSDPGPIYPVTSLLVGDHDSKDIVLNNSSWPAKIPLGVKMDDLGTAISIVQRMQAAGCDDGSRLKILDSSGSALLAISRADIAWRVSVLWPEV